MLGIVTEGAITSEFGVSGLERGVYQGQNSFPVTLSLLWYGDQPILRPLKNEIQCVWIWQGNLKGLVCQRKSSRLIGAVILILLDKARLLIQDA